MDHDGYPDAVERNQSWAAGQILYADDLLFVFVVSGSLANGCCSNQLFCFLTQANLEAFLKGKTFIGDQVEISNSTVKEINQECEDLPLDEQFKEMQRMRAETQVTFH